MHKFYILHPKFRDKTIHSVARLIQLFHEYLRLFVPKQNPFQYHVVVGC